MTQALGGNTMKKLIATSLLVALPVSAFATAQVGEYLVYQGKTNETYTTPLESYFSKDNPRPEFPMASTACWRGYIGVWRIESNTLYLVSLHEEDWDASNSLGKELPLGKMFPKQPPPIPATWFSDVLRLPQGEELRYVHMGFGTVHEKDAYITIKKGKVTAERIVNNRGKGATQSTPDLQWVALAEEPVEDDGRWYDGRLLRTASFAPMMDSGTNFLTRGIFFGGSTNEPAHLWIPDTPTTKSEYLPLNTLPAKHGGTDGSHVEIQAHFADKEDHYELNVDQVRQLKPGETMHHPDFKSPNKEIQPTK